MQILAVGYLKYPCGRLGFSNADGRRTARPHVTRGEINDAGPVARFRHAQHRAAAGLLHVIRMRGDREKIQWCGGRHILRHVYQ